MTSTDRDLLVRAGQALYGSIWQSELARSLGFSDRTVRAWVGGTRTISPRIWSALGALLERRRAGLGEVADLVVRRARSEVEAAD